MENRQNLELYQQFTREFGYLRNPHTYKKHEVEHLNVLSMPWLLSSESLLQLTGLTPLQFWAMAEQLAISGT